LDGELASQVTSRNKELLGNVRRMLDAENSLADVVLSVETLQSAVRRIRAEIAGPYEHIKARTCQLRNLHATVGMLRHLIHRIKLAQKLRQQMAAPASQLDLAKAAKLLTDIHAVDAEIDLTGVDAVDADAAFLAEASKTIHDQAEAALSEGMESMSQAKVGSALQVFFNLDQLPQAVDSLLSRYTHELERAARAALDARALSAAAAAAGHSGAGGIMGSPGAGLGARSMGAGGWQDKLWGGLKEVADTLSTAAAGVWHLQRVVAKKKDPLSHVCFLDVLVPEGKTLLCTRFWDDAVRVLGDAFASVSRPSTKAGFLRDALVASYPKLAHTFESMFERLATETTMKGVLPAVTPEQLQQLLGATAPLQNAYLGGCLARMSDAVTAAFPGGARSLPSPADVQKLIGVLHEELKAGGICPQLAAMVAATAGKALALLAEKAEYMAATGPEVRVVPGPGSPATPPQVRNIALCSSLQEVHRSLVSLLPRLPPAAAPALGAALEAVQATAIEVVAPIFKSAMEGVEERLVKMHDANYGAEGGEAGMVNTSTHISDVVALMGAFRSEVLARFVPPPSPQVASAVSALVERMAARSLIFFVRHASLVRPLGQAGKLQLAKDMAELQLGVGSSLWPLEALGPPFRVVKAFRSLLFTDAPPTVLTSPLLRELPASITAHHLFSRLPATIPAPHERSGLSAAQYSLWLDSHSVDEVLRGVSGALDAAPSAALGEPPAPEVVAVIRQLCAQAAAAAAAAGQQGAGQ